MAAWSAQRRSIFRSRTLATQGRLTLVTRNVIPIDPGTPQANVAKLLKQYGCGPIQFIGPDGFYERHLLFDNIKRNDAIRAREQYEAFARSVRDVLAQRWVLTEETYERKDPKRVYYLSMEFLL